jgi:protease I
MALHKIALIVASQGYQPVEYSVPKHIIEAAGISVVTVSDQAGTALAKDNSSTAVDMLLNDVSIADYDGIVIVGGPGAMDHLNTPLMHTLITAAVKSRKVVGAICVSTRILAQAGILDGKKATGWNGDEALEGIYKECGAKFTPKDVVVDAQIVTATGPKAAQEFGEEILKLLPID